MKKKCNCKPSPFNDGCNLCNRELVKPILFENDYVFHLDKKLKGRIVGTNDTRSRVKYEDGSIFEEWNTDLVTIENMERW